MIERISYGEHHGSRSAIKNTKACGVIENLDSEVSAFVQDFRLSRQTYMNVGLSSHDELREDISVIVENDVELETSNTRPKR